jgi:spore coat protein A
MIKNHYPAANILAITLVFFCATAAARNPIANDWAGYYGLGGTSGVESNSMAIMESSTGARCQVCHVESGGGSPWNAYGWAVRQAVSGGDWVGAFMAVEDSDSDGNGNDNIDEIMADAQPGWTTTGNLGFLADLTTQLIPDQDIPAASPLDPAGASEFACCFATGDCSVLTTEACTTAGGTSDIGNTSCFPNMCPQPTGACCNLEETCSDGVAANVCIASGGTPQDPGSMCSDIIVDCGLEPFVDSLPIPGVMAPVGTRPDGAPQYEITVQTAQQQLHSELPLTDLWTYNGTYPSLTIEARSGEPIEVTYINNLPPGGHLFDVDECAHGPNYYSDSPRIVTHLHGGHVPARFDGQPEYHIMPGEMDVYEYGNDQLPATLWYHDHALGITRLNVYGGMAGYYLLRDDFEDALGLPAGEFEIPAVIQDREFNPDGSLSYPTAVQDTFFGDKVLVNGKVWPSLDVKQGKYRFRFVNGSQAREYSLRLENQSAPAQVIPFTLIGTDLGLISAPILINTINITPAERFDVVIDFAGFSAGTQIVLRNDDTTSPIVPNVMRFEVIDAPGHTDPIPATLRPVTPIPEVEADVTRWFRLERVSESCAGNEWLIQTLDGPGGTPTGDEHWDDLSEFVELDTTEIWEFENPSQIMHPMHIHLVAFQVLDRSLLSDGTNLPLAAHEFNTWKDTVAVPAGTRVRVIARYEDFLGRFPYHCHILDHEDHEMMRQFVMINDPANCDLDGACEAGEDGFNCADCPEVSGALCGNGLCEIGDGEDCLTCPLDCNGDQQGGNPFCCGNGGTNPIACGTSAADARCIDTSAELFCRVAERVKATCGDLLCEGQESAANCPQDCSVPFCEPTETIDELSCTDGQDNDCDGLVDSADTDCPLPDTDGDGVPDASDNCPGDFNPLQEDFDGDGAGYVCDTTCATTINFSQTFSNGDIFELLASDSITFEGTMESGSAITFDAPNLILQNTTSIQVGATFRSKSAGCTP